MSEKIEQFWRDATADDVARVMRGEAVEIRVRDADREDWREGEYLGGFHRGSCEDFEWKDRDGVPWIQCQVYDPPEILKNKPEPGEGYRLLEKFPPEEPQEGDQAKHYEEPDEAWVTLARGFDPGQRDGVWYRRRIQTNNPEIPDSSNSSETPNSSRSRDTIPSGWRLLGKDEERLASDAYWSLGAKDWIIIGDDRVADANEFHKWHAIRQCGVAEYYLCEGCEYSLPSGKVVQVTAKGFEVL